MGGACGILRAIIDGDERTAATLAVEHVVRAGSDFLAGFYATVEVPSLQQEGGNPSPAKTRRLVTRNGKRKSAKDVWSKAAGFYSHRK